MASEVEVVDVWLGQFPNEEAADAYFEEVYADPVDGAEQPISLFAADMHVSFYDHDFLERVFHPQGVSDLSVALAGHSYSSSYLRSVVDAVAESGVQDPVNMVLLVWGREIEMPVSVRSPSMSLRYVGRFACDPKAPTAADG